MHHVKGSRIALKALTAHKLWALPAIVGIVVGVTTVIGVSCGAFPARRVARVDPIVALRAD
jgi:ABC-type antimicrobial peptide transport system permease subunit